MSLMFVKVGHKHKCSILAQACMGRGRKWWAGKLRERVKEFPAETHCLHLKTPLKDITFLCNEADFQQLQVLCRVVTGKLSETWINSMVKIVKKK